jgi:hypothetical protein
MTKKVRKSLAKALGRAFASVGPKDEVFWQPRSQEYPRLTEFDPGAEGLGDSGGVFAIWHLGVRPQWLKVGVSKNLAETFDALAEQDEVVVYDRNRGVFAAWACSSPEQWAGQVKFMTQRLEPALQHLNIAAELSIAEGTALCECPLPPGTAD